MTRQSTPQSSKGSANPPTEYSSAPSVGPTISEKEKEASVKEYTVATLEGNI